MQPMTSDPEALAAACSAALHARDRAAHLLGIEILEVGPGRARLALEVRPELTNGLGIIHGGFVFTLADTAFAHACNAYDRRTVAAGASIELVSSAREGERLVATASERHRAGRSGAYDVTVTTADGRLVALFRGRAHEIGGPVRDAPL